LFEKLIARLDKLSTHTHPSIKKNASNVLQIMATEEQSQKLLLNTSADTIPRMVKDLASSDAETVKSAAGTFWNMGKSEDIRIKIREEQGIEALVRSLERNYNRKNMISCISVVYKLTGAMVACSLDDESAVKMVSQFYTKLTFIRVK
jgi:hypothetical protein